MNIAVIGFFGFYGSIAEWVADALESLDHKVTRYDRNMLPNIGSDHQLYLYVDCSEDYSSKMPETKGYKVFWSMDAQMPGGVERSTNIGRKCDIVFSSNKEFGVDLLKKFGVNSYLLPVTYSENLLEFAWAVPKTIDVVMIGNPNSPQRLELWKQIKARYPVSFVGRAETREMYVEAMNKAKIIVNQPTEPWNNILNNRLFEGMASQALVLQKRLCTSLIKDLGFVENRDFIYWNEFDELFGLIDQYLKDDESRKILAKNGNEAVQKYSMKKQCDLLIGLVVNYIDG